MKAQKRLFGTDGIRGVANRDLTCEMAFGLGATAVRMLGPTLVIGRDTRISGSMLEAALIAGITSRGGTALLAGVIPTPAVAFLVKDLGADGGIVISASHNPPEYNGLKIFDNEGYKLSSVQEVQLEEGIRLVMQQGASADATSNESEALPEGKDIGQSQLIPDAHERYINHAVGILTKEQVRLDTIRIAVDCGNGAAHYTTPETLRRLGAEVLAINDGGNGAIINVDSGSSDLEQLIELVKSNGACLGIAHDGDADRVIAVSNKGRELDGDYIEAICALDRKATRGVPNNTLVSTVMCNIGFMQAMQEAGLNVVQTAVGDANVLAAMRKGGHVIGGEQSGHMIFIEHNPTGDGLATALMLLAALQRSGSSLDDLAERTMKKYPQVLINVSVRDKSQLDNCEAIATAVTQAEAELLSRGGGRVLLRASGTEPLVRVMVEAAKKDIAQSVAESLVSIVESELA
ncbi:MAG: phosphoglucosamine mutase [Coriobacteriia bacterium]|nr:phosphoglucosamine mutase [Coriobacteriia bacterium]